MDNYIRRVLIEDLFELNNNYKIDLSDGCNCIYGGNGTGKTTIINLIVNSISADVDAISKAAFGSISIRLAKCGQKRARKFFTLTKENISNNSHHNLIKLTYDFEDLDESFVININSRDSFDLTSERNSEVINKIKDILHDNINLTHVPLLRLHDSDLYSRNDPDDFLQHALRSRNVSKRQITELLDPSVRVLTSLQHQFVEQANENRKNITNKLESLKSKIIEKVMIDNKLATQASKAFSKVSRAMLTQAEDVNVNAYVEKLKGASINVPEDKIFEHFNSWKLLNDNVKRDYNNFMNIDKKEDEKSELTKEQKSKLNNKFNDSYFALFAMTHFHDRFLSIVNDVENMQEQKEELTKSFRDYEIEVNKYFNNKKTFKLNEDGRFNVCSGKRKILLAELSSGEKHILTILGRAALSSEEGTIFVADEPELSLHLDWQRIILPSIIKLSPKSQVIVATHSPSIYAEGATEIDLEECM
ncbi:AAA family ATPase [Photobacterium frigidiphilum]|uniref:AAA family ATPase n=1 Tax=Photobacterium frigidiphilum TaxID=264736 RepID=UPI003D11DB35